MVKKLSASSALVVLCTCVVPTAAQLHSEGFTFHSEQAEQWFRSGEYFSWTSTTVNNNDRTVNVHYRTFGDRTNPALVLLHGYPTSSFDFREMIGFLDDDYFIATLDFPGFGFSDKPQDGYSYMLEDDAKLVDYFVREIVELDEFSLFTHDRGVSVGLAFLGNYLDAADPAYDINYHFLSNSGMFLPLANLLDAQKVMLHPVEGPAAIQRMKARPRRTEGTPQQVAYADIHAFNDGIGARLGVGKYLLERVANEVRWLDNLPRSPIPVAYIWGLQDPVNPIRIANYVWATYLNEREVESSYWIVPTGGHYPQRDHPEEMAKVIKIALKGDVPERATEEAFMWSHNRSRNPEDAIFVGHSDIQPMEFPGAVEYTPSGYR